MESVAESVCCCEQDKVARKMHESNLNCITMHTNLSAVCLNADVLQTAYYAYRQTYGATNDNK